MPDLRRPPRAPGLQPSLGRRWSMVPGLEELQYRRWQHRCRRAAQWARSVLDDTVIQITTSGGTHLLSTDLDATPGFVRLVYRRGEGGPALGLRVDTLAHGPISAHDVAGIVTAAVIGSATELDPTDLVRHGDIAWWGDGYPGIEAAGWHAGIGVLISADATAWSSWRAAGLVPTNDMAPAEWLVDGAWGVLRGGRYRARVRLSNPAGDEYEDIDALPDNVLEAIARTLAKHTTTPSTCWFAVRDGTSVARIDHEGSFAFYHPAGTPAPPPPPASLPSPFHHGPRAEIGTDDHVLFEGSVDAAPNMGWTPTGDWFWRQWAHVIWPADRAWLAVYDLDDYALDVAGTVEICAALAALPGLLSEPVSPRN